MIINHVSTHKNMKFSMLIAIYVEINQDGIREKRTTKKDLNMTLL